jgi:hypothetical protein
MIVSLASLWSIAVRYGSAVSAQCGCAVWNPGRWQHGPFLDNLVVKLGPGNETQISVNTAVNRTIKLWNQLPAEVITTFLFK